MARVMRVPPAQLQLIERLYSLVDHNAVVRFIEEYPFLASMLTDAYERIQAHFPPSPLFLEVVRDPESIARTPESDDELVLSIVTMLEPEQALDALDRLDTDWWLETLPRTKGKLTINLEFR